MSHNFSFTKAATIYCGLAAFILLLASCGGNKNESAPQMGKDEKRLQLRELSQPDYGKYFTDERLRIDLTFAGNAYEQAVYMNKLAGEKGWSGSREYLIDTLYYGEYRLELEDTLGNPIFGFGFNTLFQEWRTLEEAKSENYAFCSSYRVPFPKEKVELVIYERITSSGAMKELYRSKIDPSDKAISYERENNFNVVPVMVNGESSKKLDLLFIAEGYTKEEMKKFRSDAEKFTKYLFETPPYNQRKEDFNIWAVESVSEESGTDIPHKDIWRKSIAESNFYTFRSDRYLTAPNQTIVSKLAANAPCDAIYVIVNTEKYGGGGIYNYYGLSMSDHKYESEVFVHELGHSLCGLGDEYYYEGDVFEGSYNTAVEPWEPNITTLVAFEKKWKDMVDQNTPVPTPAESSFAKTVGVYEGAAYNAKGLFRPYINCRMKENTAESFCPVCQRAINRVIDTYCK